MMKHSWPNIAAWLFACFSIMNQWACATVVGGEKQVNATMESIPPGARVLDIDNTILCEETPCEHVFDTRDKNVVKVQADGYYSLVKSLDQPVRTYAWLNLLWINPLLIGAAFGIDYFSGSLWTVANPQKFKLTPIPEAEDEGESTVENEEIKSDDAPPAAAPAPLAKPGEIPWEMLEGGTPKAAGKQASDDAAEGPKESKPSGKKMDPRGSHPKESESMDELRQRFPVEYIRKQIRYYYGAMSTGQAEAIVERIYEKLREMDEDGESPNVDEAIRRDVETK